MIDDRPMRLLFAECAACSRKLRSPFGDGTEAELVEIAAEVDQQHGCDHEIDGEILAQCIARGLGWLDTPDGWFCPEHQTFAGDVE